MCLYAVTLDPLEAWSGGDYLPEGAGRLAGPAAALRGATAEVAPQVARPSGRLPGSALTPQDSAD